jgi:subtilisin family serine protease
MPGRRTFLFLTLVLMITLVSAGAPAQTDDPGAKVIIRAAKPYGALKARIEALGGRVTYEYKYVDAIAAELPRNALPALRDMVGTAAITKDEIINLPGSGDTLRGRNLATSGAENEIEADSVDVLGAADIQALATANPNAYLLNNSIANVSSLHSTGITGAGVIVAVIDAGIRPGRPHISLDGSVIGCEDFVGDALGCSNNGNSGHGTFVAGMISANVVFTFSTASATRNAVLAECPSCFLNPPTNTEIPMIGTAPLSSIYAFRVFGPTGGSPTSRILMAIERVIELRELFDAGMPGGANIKVCNMSLGGSTLFPGRDLFDMEVDVLLQKGIVPVISAGNAGPSSITVGSPGTAKNAITVGAASLPHNERILRRLQFGPAVGPLFRPFLGVQTSFFSSRGPNADGRTEPDVTSNGFANFGQGFSASTTGISIASGTSFSSPSVAGVAALLWQAFPMATATQIRNSIIATANPNLLSDDSTVLDQGAGYVNGAGAAALIGSGGASNMLPALPNATKNVKVNVEQGSFLKVSDGFVTEHGADLKPGERHDILYRVLPNTRQVVILLNNVTPALPPAQQNQLFGDDILLAVHSAKTSAIGQGDYQVFTFTLDGTFVINNPETGLMRITVNGDWTNAGTISADVTVLSLTDPIPQLTAQGQIADQALLVFPVNIPAGVSKAEFQLGWREDWGNYPTADIDLILVNPSGGLNFDGATLNNAERVTVMNPAAGMWLVAISGFEIHTGTDKFELRVALDGKVVK